MPSHKMRVLAELRPGEWVRTSVPTSPKAIESALTDLWSRDKPGHPDMKPVWKVASYAPESEEEWEHPNSVILGGFTDCDGASRYEHKRLLGKGIPNRPHVYVSHRSPGKTIYHVVNKTPTGLHDGTTYMSRTAPTLAGVVELAVQAHELGFSWGDLWKGTKKLARRVMKPLTGRARKALKAALMANLGPLGPMVLPAVEKALQSALKRIR